MWAKINADYEVIVGGNSYEAFNLILGAPATYFSMTSTNIGLVKTNLAGTQASAAAKAWAMIKAADANNYAMGCNTGCSNPYGLVPGHAYSLIGAVEIKNTAGQVTNRLYRVRNPWGEDVYTGNWNDKDTTRWTASAQ